MTVMEDFSEVPGGKDLNKMKAQYEMFVDSVGLSGSSFSELVWFEYKVSGVMCSTSVCEYWWSIEGCIHSQRRNRFDQKLVEKLVRTHTNLVLRESLDDTLVVTQTYLIC